MPKARYIQESPWPIVGSTKFGQYPKISTEQTYNMLITDDFMVNFSGYKNIQSISPEGVGRGIYSSNKLGKMFAVIDNNIYWFDSHLSRTKVTGTLATNNGTVFIAENNADHNSIAFSDSQNLYIYDDPSNTITTYTAEQLTFTPGYLTFQNGRIISPDIESNQWRLSELNDAISYPLASQYVGTLQTKPDTAVACVRFPSRGNMLLVFGNTVAEQWYDVGATLFPYQRSQSTNTDYGCLNPTTIAQTDNLVCWLGANEKSGPVIMYSDGGEIQKISTDGIDLKLAQISNPTNSFGFMFRQDGHIFYVLTFVTDNLTYAYDFNTKSFYTLCDENFDAFIAKRVAFFNDQYYFVSIRDGNLYQLGSQFTNYDYGNGVRYEIPRVRVTPNTRFDDQSRSVIPYASFTIEQGQTTKYQGQNPIVPAVDLSLSKDGGVNYGSTYRKILNPLGRRANKLQFWGLGAPNDLVTQVRFYGLQRFVVSNGVIGMYK